MCANAVQTLRGGVSASARFLADAEKLGLIGLSNEQ